MLLVRLDDAHGLAEPRLQDVGAGDVLRVLAARVRLEHGGQQALERAVVAVGDLGQGFFGEEGLVLGGLSAHAHTASGVSRARCQPYVPSALAARPDDDAAFEERSASLQDAAAVASPLSSARAPDPPAMRAFSGVSTLSNRLI